MHTLRICSADNYPFIGAGLSWWQMQFRDEEGSERSPANECQINAEREEEV